MGGKVDIWSHLGFRLLSIINDLVRTTICGRLCCFDVSHSPTVPPKVVLFGQGPLSRQILNTCAQRKISVYFFFSGFYIMFLELP